MPQYKVTFDSNNKNWSTDEDINALFLRSTERFFDDLLRIRGHVFLNEVYSDLGFDHTTEGAIVGWMLSGPGDGFVEFELKDLGDAVFEIDFNVDGVMFHRIGEKK